MKSNDAAGPATDWDRYYQDVPFTRASCTIEIGGANSCFLDEILEEIEPQWYHVIDSNQYSNQYGLDLLKRRPEAGGVQTTRMDVLDVCSGVVHSADVVFSVGLIAHFDPEETAKAIPAHFELLKPGGCAIISFPTPNCHTGWPVSSRRPWVCESFPTSGRFNRKRC